MSLEVCVTRNEFLLPGHGPHARTGVLLLHGLTGTPNEMRLLGKGLQRAGFTVYAVQLAGHCGSQDDLLDTRWQDWAETVHAGAQRLRGEVDRMLVMGLSMGAVLALELAIARPDLVDGVGALSTMFRYDGWSMPFYTRLSFLLRPFRWLGIGRRRLFLEQPPYGIKDEALRKRVVAQMLSGDSAAAGLPGNPWYAVIEMRALADHVMRRLDRITAPCLVVHASEDDVSSPANAELVARRVSGPVEMVLLHDSYHMITIDRERRVVTSRAVEFAARIADSADAVAPRANAIHTARATAPNARPSTDSLMA
ncbi:alpha/beta hydrolase [Rhodoferax koreense]|uniref:alpha/beta hydrolase n=1 Tax=Rhodoferax koreensis TaxID=1842727 RepID=UPI0009F9E83A|nr:alpha/beta fold hydrolase [Rhodoferax koreense]